MIERERPDALLPTLGGGTALNLARDLSDDGTLARYGVRADRRRLRGHPPRRGPRPLPRDDGRRRPAHAAQRGGRTSIGEAERALGDIGLPAIVRPGFTMGGEGGGIAFTEAEYRERVAEGLAA